MLKKNIKWLSAAVIVVLLLAGYALYSIQKPINSTQPLSSVSQWKKIFNFSYSTETDLVPLQIGNYNYEIPRNYMDGNDSSDCNNEAVLLAALLPKFEGKTKENQHKFQGVAIDKPELRILMESDRDRKEIGRKRLTAMFDSVQDVYKTTKDFGAYYNLRTKKGPRHYMFYDEDNIGITKFIMCTGLQPTDKAFCQHYFSYKDLRVKMTYRIKFLPDWQNTENKMINFLDKSNIGKAKILLPRCKELFGQ